MAFNNSNVMNKDDIEAARARRRAESMFGRSSSGAAGGVYPHNERVNLPIELIDDNPDNADIFSLNGIEELAETMNDVGFSGAIEVFEKENGRYEVVAGHRRLLARKKTGESTIPAIITPMPNDVTKAKKLLLSNIHNRVLTPYEYSMMIEYYRNEVLRPEGFEGNTITECARFFMKSETTIKRYIAISKIIPALQEYTKNPSFPYIALEKAARMSLEEQEELLEELKVFEKANPDLEISHNYILQSINFIAAKKKRAEEHRAESLPSSNNLEVARQSKELPFVENKKPVKTVDNIISETPVAPKKKKNPLLPLIKTYAVKFSALNVDEYDVEDKDALLSAITELEEAILQLKKKL